MRSGGARAATGVRLTRFGFIGSRWLGLRCAERISPLSAVHWQERKKSYANDPTSRQALSLLGQKQSELAEVLERCDLVFNVLGGHIFTADEIAKCRIVNLHCAPLPAYRGLDTYARALANRDAFYAVTLHEVDEGIDTGPVLAQRWLPIYPDDTETDLYRRSQVEALHLFTDTWRQLV